MSVCQNCGFPFDGSHPDQNCGAGPRRVKLRMNGVYLTARGQRVKITGVITPFDKLDYEAGYRFKASNGQRYLADGENNDSDLVIVSEVTPANDIPTCSKEHMAKKLEKYLRDGGYYTIAARSAQIVNHITS